jgi:hypothetical protein
MTTTNAIDARLDALELTNRRLRGALAAVLLGGVAILGVHSIREANAAPPPGTVKGNRLELVDDTGNTRLLIRLKDGQPSLAMLDANGMVRSSYFLTKRGDAKLSMIADDKTVRAIYGVNKGMAQLSLFGPKGKLRNSVTVSKNGDPNTFHFNEKTKVIGRIKNKK